MSAYRYEQETVVVASARTPAAAKLIKATLAAHAIESAVSASDTAYPSLDFVNGLQVSVSLADEEAARELLRHLDGAGEGTK